VGQRQGRQGDRRHAARGARGDDAALRVLEAGKREAGDGEATHEQQDAEGDAHHQRPPGRRGEAQADHREHQRADEGDRALMAAEGGAHDLGGGLVGGFVGAAAAEQAEQRVGVAEGDAEHQHGERTGPAGGLGEDVEHQHHREG
jgi:hypothetical protein